MNWRLQERCQAGVFSNSFLKKCGPEEMPQGHEEHTVSGEVLSATAEMQMGAVS